MNTQASAELPRYQCHKQVWALKIKEVRQSPSEPATEAGTWEIVPEDERYAPITVSHEFYTKHRPIAGGYYVIYEDGYKSFSPAAAFEGGYTNVDDIQQGEGAKISITTGDVVFLKSGGPRMTAGRVSGTSVRCWWFMDSAMHNELFDITALDHA